MYYHEVANLICLPCVNYESVDDMTLKCSDCGNSDIIFNCLMCERSYVDEDECCHIYIDSITVIQRYVRFIQKLPILWKIGEYYMAKKYHPNNINIDKHFDI